MRKLSARAAAVGAAVVLITVHTASAQTVTGVALAPVTGAASLASATFLPQSVSAQRRPAPPPKPKRGLRVYGVVESEALGASRSFEAVLGTSRLTLLGAGVDATGLWRNVFLRLDMTQGHQSGQRVFVESFGAVTPLGIPLEVTMRPLEIGGGWRFGAFGRKKHVVPLVGVTGVWLHYKETSSFSEPADDTDQTFGGLAMFGGLDIAIKFVRLGVEGLYRHVPNALGDSGASKTFGETGLGGTALRFTFGIGF